MAGQCCSQALLSWLIAWSRRRPCPCCACTPLLQSLTLSTSAWRAAWRWCVTAWSRRQPCSCCCPPPHSTRPISSTCAGKLANLSALKEHSLVVMQDTCVGYDAIQVGTASWCRTTLTALWTYSILFQCPYSGKRKVLLTNIQMMSQILSIYN